MKITSLYIKNFRAIGETPLEINFDSNKVILVGRNNVGKSCIVNALVKLIDPYTSTFDVEDWHNSDNSKVIELVLDGELEDVDFTEFFQHLKIPKQNIEEYVNSFSNKLRIRITLSGEETKRDVSFAGIKMVSPQYGTFFNTDQSGGFRYVFWSQFQRNIVQTELSLKQSIEKTLLKEEQETGDKILIQFDHFDTFIKDLLNKCFLIFPEFRVRPQILDQDHLQSPSGVFISNVLFTLKNGRKELKEKYEKIKKLFSRIFPEVELDVIRDEQNHIKLSIIKDGHQSTQDYFGAGVFEIILLLTHLTVRTDKVLVIDGPEIHLHPQAQRIISSLLENEDYKNRLLLITHSPYFINTSELKSIIRISQSEGQAVASCPKDNYWDANELIKICKELNTDRTELFFADKVLIVEGETEYGAFPILGERYNSFIINGVSVIWAGGKSNIPFFVKLLEAYKIPYFVECDSDAKEIIDDLRTRYPDIKYFIMPSDFEGIIKMNYDDLYTEAKKVVGGRSKARIGRYIAWKILEEGRELSPEFKELFAAMEKI